ncbi:hypothetical protein F1D05_30170 [Kribbella qitaiheensis]|uniref:Uncharacterized protein n=1 Tax=Kribbella qitaiheensis TaxID=1544730 RepID=A0A7G6X595_9ACTN|nr:hypothetical protein [Kribbella qitaiheensis]QNE21410.1 hypothetical protein F1D05_30170 [Kribbella qitaiheensis]
MTNLSRRTVTGLLAGGIIVFAAIWGVVVLWSPSVAGVLEVAPAISATDSPPVSPGVGSAATPNPEPSGSADGDRDDWSGIGWLGFGLLIPVVVVGGVILAKRRARATPDDPRPADPRRTPGLP